MAASKENENQCPHLELIRMLSQELEVSQEVARHIYNVFYVVILKLLKRYDTVCVTPFLKINRKTSKEKLMYDVNRGEYVTTIPKEKLYCRIASRYKDVEYFDRYIDEYEEKKIQQEILKAQLEEARRAEIEEKKAEIAKERKNKRRRTKYRKRKIAERNRAIERLIHYETILEKSEKDKYRKELARRKKGCK